MLKDVDIKFKYDSDKDDLVNEFYIPVLSNSVEYYRMSGYFSSSSLAIAARGIADFILNGGKMKLLCNAQLTKEDYEIIENTNQDSVDYIQNLFIDDLHSIEDEFIKNHVKALGWMLANGFLEIKIAIPKDKNGIFHSKVGVLKDNENNFVSFSGSDNETAAGWLYNIEEFKVFKSWDSGEEKYVSSDLETFFDYWNGITERTRVIDLPSAVREELIEFAPVSRKELVVISRKTRRVINLRDYQDEAIDSWFAHDCRGLFEMATGTGKTITSLSAFKQLSSTKDKLVTVIACPQLHLIDQWIKDVENVHSGKILKASSKEKGWKTKIRALSRDFYMGLEDKVVIMTTHNTVSSDFFIEKIKKIKSDKLLIVDEVHGMGSSQRLNALIEDYDYRLGLSATPKRWFDEEGTQAIYDYFGDVVFEFDIKRALTEINPDTGKHYLTPYYYYPIVVDLNSEEYSRYRELSQKIAQAIARKKNNNEKISLSALCNERQKIINNAEEKYSAFRDLLKEHEDIDKLIVYCSDRQIDRVQEILNEENIIPQHRFTHKESSGKTMKELYSQRELILRNFEKGNYRALVAIKCLDEGVDVPVAENAIILSSTSNPREHVQRRGRILRNAPGKEYATIYDFLVFPKDKTENGSKIMKKEINRYKEFAELAINSLDCLEILDKYYYST
ncbi:DEAD/DEAH box helicase family protein [Methanobrevibacter sp.]|uniref:DEAD/DEAH box helicase family protein n=1 Tax=Methanobrevibacter sp. TaxID=66852 RepID=UPI003864914F